jgi:hypothetical protein
MCAGCSHAHCVFMTRRYANNEYSESIAEAPLLTGIHRVGDPCFNGVSGKALESLWIVVCAPPRESLHSIYFGCSEPSRTYSD